MGATDITIKIGKGKTLYAVVAKYCDTDEEKAKQFMLVLHREFKERPQKFIEYFGKQIFIDFQVYCLINGIE